MTDGNTKIGFGEHKDKMLKDIPDEYFINLYNKNEAYWGLKLYIERSIPEIIKLRKRLDKIPKYKAARILEELRHKLYVWSFTDGVAAKVQIEGYIKTFFGESSPQYEFIRDFKLNPEREENKEHSFSKNDRNHLESFLKNCEETILVNGLHKTPKVNWLYRINNAVWIPVLLAAFGGMFILGEKIGSRSADVKNIELKRRIEVLEDSLKPSPALSIPNHVPQNDTASTNNN